MRGFRHAFRMCAKRTARDFDKERFFAFDTSGFCAMNMVRVWLCLLLFCVGLPGLAQDRPHKTGLPLPRFVSIKTDEANARRGPHRSHRIDWVYRRAGLPVEIIDEYVHWRKIRDSEGQGGWMYYTLLSGQRTALVTEQTPLRRLPDPEATSVAILDVDVVARIIECRPDWCRLRARGYRGWVQKSTIWGVREGEVFP